MTGKFYKITEDLAINLDEVRRISKVQENEIAFSLPDETLIKEFKSKTERDKEFNRLTNKQLAIKELFKDLEDSNDPFNLDPFLNKKN